MLSNRPSRRLILLGLTGLAGCGFAPVLGDKTRGQFQFQSSDSVAGFRLNERLEERLGAPAAPLYVIKSTVGFSESAAAIAADGDRSRLNVVGTANWSIVEIATGTQLETGKVEAFTSYSATGSTIATQTTRDDARARLSVILADMIVTRVSLAQPA